MQSGVALFLSLRKNKKQIGSNRLCNRRVSLAFRWQECSSLAFCRTAASISRLIDSNPKQMSANFYYPGNNFLPALSQVQNFSRAFSLFERVRLMPQKHFKSTSLNITSRLSVSSAAPAARRHWTPVPVKPSPNTCAQPAYHKIPTSLAFQSEWRPVRVGPRWF